ncbi:MAG: methyl-accepting chemotaxis protein [Desulfamplus sp.]|nr:methyl-accepting chemotaxis protein [Desulfamplus sp.]
MKFFYNLKMATKLVGGFGIVLLLFVCVMAIYHITVQSTSNNFQELMKVNVAIAAHSADIKTLMKQCRIDEKNFLSSLDKKHLKELESNIKLLTQNAQNIVTKARDSHNSSTAKKAENISKYIDTYSKAFNELSQSYEHRGLDVNSGLRGAFAKAADTLVLEMAYVDVEDLYVQMLRIVQAQSRYWSEDDDGEYLKKIEEIITGYQEVINRSTANEGMIKDTLKDVLATYQQSLAKLKTAKTFEEGSVYFKEMQEAISEIDEVFNVTYLPNAKPLILEIRSREKDYLLFGGNDYASKAQHAISTLFKAIEKSTISDDYKKNSFRYLTEYKKAFDNLILEDDKIAKLYEKMSDAVNNTEPLIDELYNSSKTIAADRTKEVMIKAGISSKIAMGIGFGAILFGFCLSFFITRMITVPITKAVNFSRLMSQGDFTRTLDINQRDEIGVLASALNEIVTNIGGMVKNISGDVNILSSSSIYLKDISLDMSQRANNTALKFNAVATATEEMSSNLTSIAAAIEETSANLNTVAAATEENTVTINEIAQNTDKARIISNQAVAQAKSTSVDIKRLEDAARDIGKVTETIADISGQTNLLALNATIEAARAGEAGKGFAVVANEIKELANQTAAATKAISSQISSVQNTTENTIQGIEKITSIITEINDIISSITQTIEDQSTATQEISSNVAQGSQGIQEIAENVAQCSSVSSEISSDIAGVNQDASQISENSCNLNGSAESLSKLAEKLKVMMGHFQV